VSISGVKHCLNDTIDYRSIAENELLGLELPDARLSHRAHDILFHMLEAPALPIRRQQVTTADTKACYRFYEGGRVTGEDILLPHQRATVRRFEGRKRALAIQDTTAVSLPGLTAATGLGPITSSQSSRGYLVHTTFSVDPDNREPLGILAQQVWVRGWEQKRRTESCEQRKKRKSEADHWPEGQREVARLLGRQQHADGKWTPIPAEMPKIIAVFDREGDIFEAMEECRSLGHGFVIRAIRNRRLREKGNEGEALYAFDEVRKAPILGQYPITVPRRPGTRERTASMEVRAKSVGVLPPKNRGRKGDPLTITVLCAREVDPPDNVEPLEWWLLTDQEVNSLDQATDVVNTYTCRWIIEEFHMGLKTGVGVEDRQFESFEVHSLHLGFASIAAWALLVLRHIARRPEEVPADEILTDTQVVILKSVDPRLPARPTVRQALRAIAGLGGFMGRKGDGEPGWRTLTLGYQTLLLMERGFRLARMPESDPGSSASIP
jgi:Transposase Tn5 dimerisation domain/Transposase DNA-binding